MNRHQEEAKEYLSQAFRIDCRIHSKMEQISSLNDLATSVTVTYTDMPGSGNRNIDRMEKAIAAIVDLEAEIGEDVCRLVETKRNISHIIKSVGDPECQTLLELRYLCFKTWEEIAVEMGYCIDNVYRIHRKALSMVRLV